MCVHRRQSQRKAKCYFRYKDRDSDSFVLWAKEKTAADIVNELLDFSECASDIGAIFCATKSFSLFAPQPAHRDSAARIRAEIESQIGRLFPPSLQDHVLSACFGKAAPGGSITSAQPSA